MRPAATIVSVNVSCGGIPKRPVAIGTVTREGLDGDAHDHEKHCTPLQALSLLDLEDLEDLRDEGFDVGPGSTGENLTVRGLQADGLVVGDRLTLSGGVVLEVTKRRKPCYVLDAISPVLKDVIAGRCGVYAKVIHEGEVRPGESIVREPAALLGAVLAGGASRRMGRPKHQMRLPGGEKMIDVVAAALRAACARDDVVVVGPPGIGTIHDRREGAGPMSGIEALLASGLAQTYLVCPCDVPRVTSELLGRLVEAPPESAPGAVFHVEGEDVSRPLPLRVSASALPVAQRLLDEGRRAVHELVAAIGAAEVRLPAADAPLLQDVNTPQAWKAMSHALHRA